MKVADKRPYKSQLVLDRRNNTVVVLELAMVFLLSWLFGFIVGHPF